MASALNQAIKRIYRTLHNLIPDQLRELLMRSAQSVAVGKRTSTSIKILFSTEEKLWQIFSEQDSCQA